METIVNTLSVLAQRGNTEIRHYTRNALRESLSVTPEVIWTKEG